MSFSVDEILSMQRSLHEKYRDKWGDLSPEAGNNTLLWMVGEIGETADIVKKNGVGAACSEPALRGHLVEELADVLMYYGDALLCYGITADDLREAYIKKYEYNMKRW